MLETIVAPDAASPIPGGLSLFDLDEVASR